ncbi:MAG: phytoene/squalene synthase family protein [Chloroflexota bacterium]
MALPVQSAPAGKPATRQDALQVLAETSRTFFIPISRLPPGLLEAVGSGYLCLRAIDEIEDHPGLEPDLKESLLRSISRALQSAADDWSGDELESTLNAYAGRLPEVTLRLCDWVRLAPKSIMPRVWDATAAMADRMADWVACNWQVRTLTDLDRYTFGVAGTVGLMLSDMWSWFDGTPTDRMLAIGFGRGLQAVNILRNRADDLSRGVDFYPCDWQEAEMQAYARRNLAAADAYLDSLPPGPAREFCRIPLVLAHATLDALEQGKSKLSRSEVLELVGA